jgi:hypothetical protein
MMLPLAATMASVLIAADDQSSIGYPEGFRSWRHVKSTVVRPEHRFFAIRGGIHHFYANDKAIKG